MTDYSELVKALRFETDYVAVEKTMRDAAAAIEELQAHLPKRGKWIIHGEPPMLVIECSVCGQKYFNHVMQEKAKYCSMCGAKMTEVLE